MKLFSYNPSNNVSIYSQLVCETLVEVMLFYPFLPVLCGERDCLLEADKLCFTHNIACWEVFLCEFITTPCIFSNIFKFFLISFKSYLTVSCFFWFLFCYS